MTCNNGSGQASRSTRETLLVSTYQIWQSAEDKVPSGEVRYKLRDPPESCSDDSGEQYRSKLTGVPSFLREA